MDNEIIMAFLRFFAKANIEPGDFTNMTPPGRKYAAKVVFFFRTTGSKNIEYYVILHIEIHNYIIKKPYVSFMPYVFLKVMEYDRLRSFENKHPWG